MSAHAAECPTITIEPTSLPLGHPGVPYQQQLNASGGTTPYSFTESGVLPVGLTFSTSGAFTGVPSTAVDAAGRPVVGGIYPMTVTATDSAGCAGSIDVTIQVLPATEPTTTAATTSTRPATTTSAATVTTSTSSVQATSVATTAVPGSPVADDTGNALLIVVAIAIAVLLIAAIAVVVVRRRRAGDDVGPA